MANGPESHTPDPGNGRPPGPNREFVAKRLREARVAAGFTQAEAGRRADISYVSIYRYEKGIHLPSRKTQAVLARVYGRSSSWFTDETLATSGPRWHGELDPDPGPDSHMEVMGVPLVAAKAGAGSFTFDETPKQWCPFRQDLLAAEGSSARHCRLVEVRGDSMSPRCPSGPLVLVDISRREFRDGSVYLMTDPVEGIVVRMACQDGRRWILVPDHRDRRPRRYTTAWQVHGLVMGCQTRLG